MRDFICLTGVIFDGSSDQTIERKIYINVRQISSFNNNGSNGAVVTTTAMNGDQGEYFLVKESAEEILRMIGEMSV